MKKSLENKKLALWLGFIIVFFTSGLVMLGLDLNRQIAIKNHKESLQIIANEKAAQVNTFMDFQHEKSMILSSMNVFKELVKDPTNTTKIDEANKRINELKSIFPGISVLTNEGIVIVGEFDPPGTDWSKQPYFTLGQDESAFDLYYDPIRKSDYYAVVGTIYDRVATDQKIGLISFDLELEKTSALMKETLESKTNEAYLINQDGLLLSGSEFVGDGNNNGVLIQEVKSEGATACLDDLKKYLADGTVEAHNEEVLQYQNYMGNEVFGAHAYAPEIKGCVIAEENINEFTGLDLIDYVKNLFQRS